MSAWVWAFVGGGTAVLVETLYVRWTGPLWGALLASLPGQVLIGLSVFHLVRSQANLFDALILWTLCTAVVRAAAVWGLGQPISAGTLAGVALMFLARIISVGGR